MMIITDKFVYIHLPKTGGTFVTHVLHELEKTVAGRLKRIFLRKAYIGVNKHGTCTEIPEPFQNRPIFTTIRNPYDRYVSQYEFKWWQKYPEQFGLTAATLKNCSNFPEISFEEFTNLANQFFFQLDNRICRDKKIGWHTEQFFRYFFKNPEEALEKIDHKYIESGEYRNDMYDVTFVHTENLNHELYGYLRSVGYRKNRVSFVLSAGKINPIEGGRPHHQKWQSYYDTKLKETIRKKERFLFQIFPKYDV